MGYRINTIKSVYMISGIRGLFDYFLFKILKNKIKVKVYETYAPNINTPIYIRIPSSDPLTYWQVFVDKEYEIGVNKQPNIIIDAGANIGLASIYFSNRFPNSKIIAIEPETSNYEMLSKNIAEYPNISPLCAALWNNNKEISLVDPGLGNSGFMTSDTRSNINENESTNIVKAITIDHILADYCLNHVDILKVDVEGAEMEVFDNPTLWIEKVDSMVVELHERMKPGCSANFYRVISIFPYKWTKGENICVTKHDGCFIPDLNRCF